MCDVMIYASFGVAGSPETVFLVVVCGGIYID